MPMVVVVGQAEPEGLAGWVVQEMTTLTRTVGRVETEAVVAAADASNCSTANLPVRWAQNRPACSPEVAQEVAEQEEAQPHLGLPVAQGAAVEQVQPVHTRRRQMAHPLSLVTQVSLGGRVGGTVTAEHEPTLHTCSLHRPSKVEAHGLQLSKDQKLACSGSRLSAHRVHRQARVLPS